MKWLCSLLFLAFSFIASAQDKKAPKPDPVFANVPDVPGLPRVLIIGDSISMGYTLPLRKLFEGKANIHRIPENGGPTTNGLAKIDKWLTVNGSNKWDIIHINFGLHDLKITRDGHQVEPEQYGKNLREIFRKIMATTSARIIFATTTPVPEGTLNPPRKNEDVLLYNKMALKIMAEHQIYLTDLYEEAAKHLKDWQRPNNVHFTEKGSKALAEVVYKEIQDVLKRHKSNDR